MTLTQAAILTKQIITISIVALILGITSFIGYRIWYAYYLAHLPPVEEKPDLKFGQLPQLDPSKTDISSSNFSYSLDTVTGGLPKIGTDPGFEKFVKVYFIGQSVATLLSPDRSKNLAEKMNIATPPEVINETKHQFQDGGKTLEVDLNNGNFSYTNAATVSAKINLDDDERLISGFKQMLSNLEVMKNDLSQARSRVTLFKISQNNLVPTQVRSEAEVARISLWPNSIDQKQIFSGDYNKSLISAVVLGNADKIDNYLSLNFTYYPIDTSTFATYPLKDPEVAFEDLKSGKGIVAIGPEKPQVSITSISLGYYLPQNYNPYLQPIFIFEGPNFVAFVNAIPDEFKASQN